MSASFKIVFMGTPHFAVESLDALLNAGIEVAAIITAPDKPAGRGQALSQSAVKKYALKHNLKLLQPTSLKEESFLQELQKLNADLFVVVAFRMLPEAVWNIPKHGTINLHASLLPNYRGAAPINWAVINGEKETGVTTFFLKHEIDTGDIINQQKVEIGSNDTAGIVHDKLMSVGSKLLVRTVNDIKNNSAKRIPQQQITQGEIIHAPKIFKENCEIDWNKSAQQVHNFVRGLNPYPTAWCNVTDDKGNSTSAKIFATELSDKALQQGEIFTDNKTELIIGCKKGSINILELQLAGKKRLPIKDFLTGTKTIAQWKFLSKKISLLICFSASLLANAQKYLPDTLQAHATYDNIHVRAIYHDSLTSHFAIWVKLKVKAHKHEYHTEQIVVLDGKGKFTLADSTFTIKKNDVIIVPKNTYHAVETSSKKPLKVISIQAPYFDGSDRVFKPIPE